MKKHTLYTVQRIKKDDTLYGKLHGSYNGEETLCGEKCDENWYIVNNTFDGDINCRKCLKKLNKSKTTMGY